MHPQRIGMLDPDDQISTLLQRPMLRRGYLCDVLHDPDALELYCHGIQPSAIILTGTFADMPEKISELRNGGFIAPIVTLHDSQAQSRAIENLAQGADDALSLSMPLELILDRLDLIFSNSGDHQAIAPVQSAFYSALTPTEHQIVGALVAARSKTLTREDIMWTVKRKRVAPDDRTLDVYISNIRRKIRLSQTEISIETVRGKGFRFRDDTQAE